MNGDNPLPPSPTDALPANLDVHDFGFGPCDELKDYVPSTPFNYDPDYFDNYDDYLNGVA